VPVSLAIVLLDFSGLALIASLAISFGTYGLPQLQDALASAPQAVHYIRCIDILMTGTSCFIAQPSR
jgi:hypothetical protein